MEVSREEFEELYGDVEVVFESYYKYMFTYTGTTADGKPISVSYGGCGDDVYRYEVEAGQKVKVRDVHATYGTVYEDEELNVVHRSFYDGF